jgi:quinol monooxygenase YgiN
MHLKQHAGWIRINRLHPAPGARDQLVALLRQLAQTTAEAEGCYGAQVCDSVEDPNIIVAIARWRDRLSFESFAGQSLGGMRDSLAPLLAEPIKAEHYLSLDTEERYRVTESGPTSPG